MGKIGGESPTPPEIIRTLNILAPERDRSLGQFIVAMALSAELYEALDGRNSTQIKSLLQNSDFYSGLA